MAEYASEPRLRQLRQSSHRATDRCNNELNSLATKYYEILSSRRRKHSSISAIRKNAGYRGKHSFSPMPLKLLGEAEDRIGQVSNLLTPMPKGQALCVTPISKACGAATSREQNTALNSRYPLSAPGQREGRLLPVLAMPKLAERPPQDRYNFPSLRQKKRIDIDLRTFRQDGNEGIGPKSIMRVDSGSSTELSREVY